MIAISARSPYQIIIDEVGQTGSKVELFIWNKGNTEPTTPTYTMSESIASATQTETNYNISPYILEYINLIIPAKILVTIEEENTAWCLVKVKRYKIVGTATTLLNTIDYVGINGFTKVSDGLNFDKSISNLILLLSNKNINTYYNQSINENPYVNVIIDKVINKNLFAIYERNDGVSYSVVQNLLSGQSGIFNLKIPLTLNATDGNFVNGCRLSLTYQTSGATINNTYNTYPTEECKYTPVECSYINSFGGWQFLTFFKAQKNDINIKGSEYSLLAKDINYNPLQGQRKSFNINGMQTVKLNTGFVDENYNELIFDLMMSETVLLDNVPVNVKTQSLTYKTHLKDKNINYEVEFDYANNLLNNIV